MLYTEDGGATADQRSLASDLRFAVVPNTTRNRDNKVMGLT